MTHKPSLVIEILYPEFLAYGEIETARYLPLLFPEAEFHETTYLDEPYFARHSVDFLFIGPMAEENLERMVTKLKPWKNRLKEMIHQGVTLLILNNAMDVFAKNLTVKNGIPAVTLGLLPYQATRDYDHRVSELALFRWANQPFIGSVLGFSRYVIPQESKLFEMIASGEPLDESDIPSGFRFHNVFCIEVAGCIFLSNPALAKGLRRHFMNDERIPMEKEMQFTMDENLRLMSNDPAFSNAISQLSLQ